MSNNLMKAIIRKRFILEESHRRIVNYFFEDTELEDTELDYQITILFLAYRQCRILLNNIDVTHSFDVWRDASLEIGDEIVIEVVPKERI